MKNVIIILSVVFCFCNENNNTPEYTTRQFIRSIANNNFKTAEMYVAEAMLKTVLSLQQNEPQNILTLKHLQSFNNNPQCNCEIYHSKAICYLTNNTGMVQSFTLSQENNIWLLNSIDSIRIQNENLNTISLADTPKTIDIEVYYWIDKKIYGKEYYENSETEIYIEVKDNRIIKGFKTTWVWDEAGEDIEPNTILIVRGEIKESQAQILYFNFCGCADQDCLPCSKQGDSCCEKKEKLRLIKSKILLNPKMEQIKSSKFLDLQDGKYYQILKNKLYANTQSNTSQSQVLDLYFQRYEKF